MRIITLDAKTQYNEIKKITVAGIFTNISLALLKLTFGLIGSSQAVVADAIHSLSDMSTDFAILFGLRFWSKPADKNHPYGHKRIETIISALIGLILILVAFAIGYNAITTLNEPDTKKPEAIALYAAFISIIAKEILYRKTLYIGKKTKSPATIANAWHHRSDALSSIPVFLAVLAAVINPSWSAVDHIGAMIVSIFIVVAGLRIIRPALTELCDSGVPETYKEKIFTIAMKVSNVKNVHAIRYRKMASEIFVDLHIMVDSKMSVYEGHEIARKVKNEIIDMLVEVVDVTVHIEPYTQ